jgi:hypothetical protein
LLFIRVIRRTYPLTAYRALGCELLRRGFPTLAAGKVVSRASLTKWPSNRPLSAVWGGPRELVDRRHQCALAELSEKVGRLPSPGSGTGQTISADRCDRATRNTPEPGGRQLLMRPELASIILAIGLLIGFTLGYGVRAFISYRRHQASRRRRYIQ